jgi:hypothetical protein
MLIALSLTLAPVTSAWATMQPQASMMTAGAAASTTVGDATSDCMKSMQSGEHGQAKEQNFPCCDAPSKSMCPDLAACFAKCSVQLTAVPWPAMDSCCLPIRRHDRPVDAQKPPDWAFAPPAPPPRA